MEEHTTLELIFCMWYCMPGGMHSNTALKAEGTQKQTTGHEPWPLYTVTLHSCANYVHLHKTHGLFIHSSLLTGKRDCQYSVGEHHSLQRNNNGTTITPLIPECVHVFLDRRGKYVIVIHLSAVFGPSSHIEYAPVALLNPSE